MDGTLCPFCGAYSTHSCEIEDEDSGTPCPWEEIQPDPDRLREDRDERRRLERTEGKRHD